MLGVRPLRSRLNTAASEAELWLMLTVPVMSPEPSLPENVHTADLAEEKIIIKRERLSSDRSSRYDSVRLFGTSLSRAFSIHNTSSRALHLESQSQSLKYFVSKTI